MVLWQMEGGPLLAELQSFELLAELLAELAKDLGRFPRRHLRSDKLCPRFSGTLRASPSSNRCRIFVARTLLCLLSSLLMLAFSPRPAQAKDHTPPASMPLVLKLRIIASSTYGRPNLELEPIQQQLVKQGPAVIDPLRALLKDPDIRVGAAAATVLQTFDNPQVQKEVLAFALRTLVERPRSSKEPTGPGFFLLREIGKAALPAMMSAYANIATQPLPAQDLQYIHLLLMVARQLPDRAGRPLLWEALAHPWPGLVMEAAEWIGAPGDREVYERLIVMLDPGNVPCTRTGGFNSSTYRIGVLRGLANTKNQEAVEPIYNLLISLGPAPSGPKTICLEPCRPTLRGAISAAVYQLTGEDIGNDSARLHSSTAFAALIAPSSSAICAASPSPPRGGARFAASSCLAIARRLSPSLRHASASSVAR